MTSGGERVVSHIREPSLDFISRLILHWGIGFLLLARSFASFRLICAFNSMLRTSDLRPGEEVFLIAVSRLWRRSRVPDLGGRVQFGL